ncbi:MAG: 16S rRNA (adenine(1518)-N(6)/adenine(1519)-N(6))-dimethyltransferase RsmA [Solirubrobacteraceae bacterium]
MRDHAIRPRHDLGQNFLVDDNILDVIARLAELHEDDVALEVGGGLGVLSEHLLERVAVTHVIEVDRGLEAPLREALAGGLDDGRAQLHFGDAVRFDLSSLDPAPTVVVSNLPYSVAATVILRTVAELGTVQRWVAMVQREVGERFAARPGTSAYGAPSALAQLSCDVRVLRRVPRAVFSPVPNVDSVLLGLHRVRPPVPRAVRELVDGAFRHRRKALPRSLSHVPGAPADRRDAARTALERIGERVDVRAERLSAERFVDLAAALADVEGDRATADVIATWRAA